MGKHQGRSCLSVGVVAVVMLAALTTMGKANPTALLGRSSGGLTDRLLNNIERLEAALLRERVGSARGEDVVDDDPSSAASSLTQLLLDSESSDRSTGNSNNNLHLSVPPERVEQLRNLRRNLRKKNYNLDHLARMNFRRSFRASSALNNKHILGGLKK